MPDDDATMTLLEHLEELRSRLIVSVVAVVLGAVVGLFLSEPVLELLRRPLPDEGAELIVTRVTDAFAVRLKLAGFVGIVLAMPVILFQVWRFVTPGLTRHERRVVWPLLIVALLLFAAGVGIGYAIIPYAVEFLLSFRIEGVPALLELPEYVGFVTTMMIVFGIVFEFPILLIGLARVGILDRRRLARGRRWAILAIVLFAIVATPGGDPISPIILSSVMYLLYEAALLVVRLTGR
ncbi:MAG TPA: twin-arginine translocase subunit TatC [Candidatus Limnocylindria bacterium]|nr:twin-arginine translocase subunit TatC [Candidatus Limnocylindria bacterium]